MIEAINGVPDGAVESAGISEGAISERMLFEVAPASFHVVQLGAGGSHLKGNQTRLANARVVGLLWWIGPLSRTVLRGRARSTCRTRRRVDPAVRQKRARPVALRPPAATRQHTHWPAEIFSAMEPHGAATCSASFVSPREASMRVAIPGFPDGGPA